MESNEQIELTCKIEIDSQIERRVTALDGGGWKGGRIKQKRKELVDTDNSMLIVGGGESGWRWKRVLVINGYSKNTTKMNY